MVSVIVAAYNEEAVIGACLSALAQQVPSRPDEVIVSANNCSDATAAIAAERGSIVIDRPEPGKAGALNAADERATTFPRIYLDADIVVPPTGVADLITTLDESAGIFAAVPRRRIETSGRSVFVKSYFAINERLPAFRHGLFGRGMIAVSAAGRARFDKFPSMIADDLFIDSVFTDAEKAETNSVEVVVEAPYRTRDLIARLVRVRRGNSQMRAAAASGEVAVAVRPADKWAWLREVVARDPRLLPAAVPYVVITLVASVLARRTPTTSWGRDTSTRISTTQTSGVDR